MSNSAPHSVAHSRRSVEPFLRLNSPRRRKTHALASELVRVVKPLKPERVAIESQAAAIKTNGGGPVTADGLLARFL